MSRTASWLRRYLFLINGFRRELITHSLYISPASNSRVISLFYLNIKVCYKVNHKIMRGTFKHRILKSRLNKKYRLTRAKLAAKIISGLKIVNGDFIQYDFFDLWLRNGFFIIPNHFYHPIPDPAKLSKGLFKKKSDLKGIDFNEKEELKLLKSFSQFEKEYNRIPIMPTGIDYEFHFNNYAFDGVDALLYYSLIRSFKPKNIIEIGCGWSSKIAAQAALKNINTKLICVEPYPQEFMKRGYPGLTKLYSKDVQELPLSFFSQLGENDILFIDSSHTVKTGGDVNYLFLEVLPRLKKGVLIHIHDIFFPYDYPQDWVLKEHRYWAEQYLLQAFLIFNSKFKIIYSNSFIGTKYPQKVKSVFSRSPYLKGGSIWIKKIED